MGMPSFVYRWYFRARGVRASMRSILGLVGVAPVRLTLIGSVEAIGDGRRTEAGEGERRWESAWSHGSG